MSWLINGWNIPYAMPCPSGPRVTINDAIRESVVEAREEGRHSGRRLGAIDDMEDIVSFGEGVC